MAQRFVEIVQVPAGDYGRYAYKRVTVEIKNLGKLNYEELGDIKRQVDAEVIRRVMAKVERKER